MALHSLMLPVSPRVLCWGAGRHVTGLISVVEIVGTVSACFAACPCLPLLLLLCTDSVCGGGSKPNAELEVTSAAAAAAARAPTPSATAGTGAIITSVAETARS